MASSIGTWMGGGGGGGSGRRTDVGFGSPFSSDIWDPLGLGFGGGLGLRPGAGGDDDVSALAHATVDWRETDKNHIFRVDIPGVKKEDVKVQIEDDNILEISGERIKEEEKGDDKWHRVERSRGSFRRRFRLPENADVEEISCGLENGVLTVNVPKKETQEVPKNVKSIDIA
ncbi:17.5 kDa class I heat shock protein [Capsicum annuum]|uniref:16.9 kDa class I heat shock protein 1 n=1 Tax=Capsicum annuum TaxID=4072 RepID=UPI001FB19B3B|nr:16.9 kDa class I heat shock protein 1 [Capsicum annuum]KAF3650219.1 17.5 kDa class I heat shock protein [Capsicum annuum]